MRLPRWKPQLARRSGSSHQYACSRSTCIASEYESPSTTMRYTSSGLFSVVSRSRRPSALMATRARPSLVNQAFMPGRSVQPSCECGRYHTGALKPITRSAISPSNRATRRLAPTIAAGTRRRLIKFKSVLVVLLQRGILPVLHQEAIAHREGLDLGAHEAAEGVFRAADDRLAAHVEAGVDDHRTTGQALEAGDQLVIFRIRLPMHGLHARRVVDVRDRRDRRARHVQLVDAEELVLLLGHRDAVLLRDVRNQEHVRTFTIQFKISGH